MKKIFSKMHKQSLLFVTTLLLGIGQSWGQISLSTEPDLCEQGRGQAILHISPELESECTIHWEWGTNLMSVVGLYEHSSIGGSVLSGLVGKTRGKVTVTINGCNVKIFQQGFKIGEEECKLNVSISSTTMPTNSNCETPSVMLTANVSGGNGNYTYSWGGQTKTVSSTGLYTVTVTDSKAACMEPVNQLSLSDSFKHVVPLDTEIRYAYYGLAAGTYCR